MAVRRKLWRAAQPFIDPEALVFLDETGVNTKMARLYGWAPVGERCRDAVPFGHWKTMTFIAGLRLTGMTAPWVLDGTMDGDAFRTYVREVLAPTLRRGDVVVLDNLPAHKVAGIREAIAARRAQLFYLPPPQPFQRCCASPEPWAAPPYSPDMNPIEMAFAKALLSLSKGSRRCCDRNPPEPSAPSSSASACCSTASFHPNAPTSSTPPAINTQHENALATREER